VDKKNPDFAEMVRMRVVLTVPGMDAVSIRRDVVFKTADGQQLRMDIYSPSVSTGLLPAVILIHGGPIPRLGAKNMGLFVSYGELLAASGFVAVTFDHRFLTPAAVADAAGDVADLVAHVRTSAGSLGVDAERIAAWAFSGGGPFLAPMLRDRPGWLRAVVAYYAVLDAAIEGLGHNARTAPPILVARAAQDNASLNGTIDRFVQAALDCGATLDLLNHPEGRHGFDILDDDPRSRQIIRRTLVFLRDHLVAVPE
jgi:acetyl esterase/lipase